MYKNINIGIIGLGQIGSRLYEEILSKKKDIVIKTGVNVNILAISAKNINKKRNFKFSKKIFYKNPIYIAKDPRIDIVFELIGYSDGLSKKVVELALKNKKHVITANKALIAKNGDYLSSLAEKNKVNLEFEASVGGGIPILRTIKEGLATNKINKVVGILNGTCNYILSKMESSKDSFANVLRKAQILGYAETRDPRFDLNGYDTLAKVRILSALVFNNKISKNNCLMNGIENIELEDIKMADKLNFRIKLLGITEIINNQLFERVHPCLIKKDTYIANINGVMNAVILEGKPVGQNLLQGEGAGPGPTSSALMSDLLSILRGNIKYPFGLPFKKRKKINTYDKNQYLNSLYLRFDVKDKPGVLSSITKVFTKNKISIKNLIQKPDKKNKTASIVILTHESREKNFNSLIFNLNNNKFVKKKSTFIRIEKV
ncbi:MAG: homoserine dehydrogenase [Pelagibacteraceae bacterium]|jgi:homoserine dehydrogenase|nr:homoserine dehydrogenase [Pelagibacteraceae bacterium]MDP6710174.1 homoserine dehydrogenase [Pelagibacteraceae bacterium]|tara:strand:- start:2504 stop:3799 length:1296 start_codon:yes stop_codon:yes gene_type:complete